jgi:hypothetical protein
MNEELLQRARKAKGKRQKGKAKGGPRRVFLASHGFMCYLSYF